MAPSRKTPPLRSAVFPTTPWKWDIVVLHGGTPDAFVAFSKTMGVSQTLECNEFSDGHCYLEAGVVGLVWVRTLTNLPALVHELMHMVFGLLEARGLKPTVASEEAYTYTVEDLLRRILATKQWVEV